LINGSRRKRIAKGSGTTPQEINQLLDQFGEMRTMIRQMSSGKGQWAKMARQYAKAGGDLSGMPGLPGMPAGMSMPAIPSTPGPSGRGKKSGKAARKEKRKQRARSRR